MSQKPDTKPGDYYVSAIDGKRYALLLGPFRDDHKAALAMVDKAQARAMQVDIKAPWYSYGTCRLEHGTGKPGVFNAYFGVKP